jgi:release factor glutamine methyltransferase
MATSDTWTIGRLLTWTTDYLKQHGSDSPRLDAEVLLATARNCPRIALYTAFDEVASDEIRTAFRELVKRRAEGMPVAYLVGKREFFSLSFRVTPDVLIPRPETETLVSRMIDVANVINEKEISLADVGTGSGIIAITAAKHLTSSSVTAIDVSPAALAVTKQNAADHGVAERIDFIESDLFAAVPPERTYDIIASNPPYVGEAEFATLALSIKDFEPRTALVAGPQGTEVIERLVSQAAERLKPDGWLLLEVSPMIELAVRELISASGRFELHSTLKDPAGLPRVMQAKRI